MARRADDVQGGLVYQEGKNIEGEYYIIAVFDDPDMYTVSFSAYELENDCTYTYPITYEEFDEFFRFNPELLNPSNVDARFHWVVERLDFVTDHVGQKVLCVSEEPTPEGDTYDQDDDPEADLPGAEQSFSGAESKIADAASGLVNAETRTRLLKELDCANSVRAQRGLIRSEAARRKFLTDLFKKRTLEQLKAQQRLQKNDEERQARMSKLADIRSKQKEKSTKSRDMEEAQKSTMLQLEVLKKQKQANDIRKLIASRGEDGQGNSEKKKSRQAKKNQESAEREKRLIEKQREEQLGRNRELQVQKWEQDIQNKDRMAAEKIRDHREGERMIQVRRREEKDGILDEEWRLKKEERLEREARRDEFERLEDLRDKVTVTKERTRAANELDNVVEMREQARADQEKADQRRRLMRNDYLLQWRVDASRKAVALRDNRRRTTNRHKRLEEKQEMRLRKFREAAFLETVRDAQAEKTATQDLGGMAATLPPAASGGAAGHERTQLPEVVGYEQQERARRLEEAREQRRQEELKKEKVGKLGAQNPNIVEVIKFREWKKQEEEHHKHLEKLRAEHELKEELARKAKGEHGLKREEQFKAMAPKRRQASLDRQHARTEATVRRTAAVAVGTGLPLAFVY
mmetsp:Transcript_6756/g.25402  ORF Transcript_6756/g.25402 Transcript_6756/m.25402 type:complete len:634 (-) Transcript_6756:215-2116(-)|eukprot:CAMPEP_0203893268 /NCGR_PEP_ID=MMETSP0359-20131031/36356_1 /ASSEMBLY_ACC=CAM_ASM_000338 /TAXON_ID=268821 /ORGANISM="Scrippsiella Hangoei, Strain SHTV-5" /LENGTH=633 /DNA_ID=CAMNT_0050815385 /DNA_START=40 /DNA_END=1941 /DNA_ORIENTATION=+